MYAPSVSPRIPHARCNTAPHPLLDLFLPSSCCFIHRSSSLATRHSLLSPVLVIPLFYTCILARKGRCRRADRVPNDCAAAHQDPATPNLNCTGPAASLLQALALSQLSLPTAHCCHASPAISIIIIDFSPTPLAHGHHTTALTSAATTIAAAHIASIPQPSRPTCSASQHPPASSDAHCLTRGRIA